jgi:hypothetical protein
MPFECKKFNPARMSCMYLRSRGSDNAPAAVYISPYKQPLIPVHYHNIMTSHATVNKYTTTTTERSDQHRNTILQYHMAHSPNSFKMSFRDPSDAKSKNILRVVLVNSAPRYLMMLGCSKVLSIFISTARHTCYVQIHTVQQQHS